ncbi:LOW QUALITY PROTEIN: signaling lymphocytic activation molecule-like [Morus bassanus]
MEMVLNRSKLKSRSPPWALSLRRRIGLFLGMGCGVRETVLGILGKAMTLRIPPELQDLTPHSGVAVWKRDMEDPQRKLVLLEHLDGNYTNYVQGRARFHKLDFSLEIRNTSWQDRQLYQYIVSKRPEEEVWQIQLEESEPVSDVSIQILGWALANSSCTITITLNCTAEQGDNVSYSWGMDTSTLGLCSSNGSLLYLSYHLQNASIAVCTVSNPVSSWVVAFTSSECSQEQGAGLRMEHLVMMVVVPIATVTILTGVFMAAHLAMPIGAASPSLAAINLGITGNKVGSRKGPCCRAAPCTPISAAATSLPPDMAPAPSRTPCPLCSPKTEPPALWGHPPLLQIRSPNKEPTTVYASVMMPMA